MKNLIEKYNVPGPRYTSYPTVPYWDGQLFEESIWKYKVISAFEKKGRYEGISVYIHLPYCESLCTYCGCNTRITVNHSVELTYIATVLKEWKLYTKLFSVAPVIKELHLGGGTPTFFSPENLKLLIDGILENSIVLEDAEFSFEGHPNNTTAEHLVMLHSLGFKRVSFGIQDFDPKVQDIINRKQTFEQVKLVTNWAREIGYTSINYDLIYGLPLQTMESVVDTIQKVNLLKPDRIAFYSYAHVPWIKPGQRRFTEADLPDNETKRSLYEKGRAMLEEEGYKEIGMDHFALPTESLYKALKNKLLHRNFMGYTTTATSMLIGLGCSSISDTGDAFAQNSKVVEQYIEKVNEGKFPVFNGHFHTKNDLMMRKHIMNIMCKYETDWTEDSDQSNSFYETIEQLRLLENDGIVELTENGLKVTPLGKPFVRNICMAFDEKLLQKTNFSQTFSKVI